MEEVFAPCGAWLAKLRKSATPEGERLLLDGRLLDANWSNSYVEGDECLLIDLEWEWQWKVSLNAILIRNIYALLRDTTSLRRANPLLRHGSLRSIIARVARAVGVRLTRADFREFCRLEAYVAHAALGKKLRWTQMTLRLALVARWPFAVVRGVRKVGEAVKLKARSAINRLFATGS